MLSVSCSLGFRFGRCLGLGFRGRLGLGVGFRLAFGLDFRALFGLGLFLRVGDGLLALLGFFGFFLLGGELALLIRLALLLFGGFFLRQLAFFPLGFALLLLGLAALLFALGGGGLARLFFFFLLLGQRDLGVALLLVDLGLGRWWWWRLDDWLGLGFRLGCGLRFGWRALDDGCRWWWRGLGRGALHGGRPQFGLDSVFLRGALPAQAPGQRQNQQKMSQHRQGQRAAHATSGRWGELVAFGGGGVHGKALT